ncbi:MAG: DMT family transporter [Candidatus Heimdallarchaeota archaeon]|nr:DMT family transporter [Candidatus Heimdallarchaeota archaeon]MCK4877559.1 DMT family transporter [Candidatus Heimdallarchaeota archaeon]
MSLAMGIILSFTAAIAWGSSMVIFKVGVKKTDPLSATYLKGLIAIPLLVLLGWGLFGASSLSRLFIYPNYLWLILAVICIALGDFFSLFALTKIDVSIAQPVTAIYPLFTTLALLFAKIEVITWQIIVGTLIIASGVIGISFFSQRDVDRNKQNESLEEETEGKKKNDSKNKMLLGIILAFLAAFFWGGTIFFSRLLLEDPNIEVISMIAVRNGLMVAGAALLVAFRAIILKKNIIKDLLPMQKETGILALGGALAWCVGGISFFTAVKHIGAGMSTPLSSISPFIVMLLGGFFLKEKISLPQLVGVLFIVIGSIVLSLS